MLTTAPFGQSTSLGNTGTVPAMKIMLLGTVQFLHCELGDNHLTDQERRILVVLASELVAVSQEELFKRAWPPTSTRQDPRRAVVTAMCELRRKSTVLRDAISDDPTGHFWRLELPVENVDVRLFLSLANKGFEASSATARFRLLDDAVNLWGGDPLGGLKHKENEYLRDTLFRFLRRHGITVMHDWLDCALELGKHREVLAKAKEMHSLYRDDDKSCAALMTLSFRCGESREAMVALKETKAAWLSEIGEPAPTYLDALAERIRCGDDTLRWQGDQKHAPWFNVQLDVVDLDKKHVFSFEDVGELYVRLIVGDGSPSCRPLGEWTLEKGDVVVGINRGGAILGGMLAFHFGLGPIEPMHILWVDDPQDPDNTTLQILLQPSSRQGVRRVLLADDGYRNGDHVALALRTLRNDIFPGAEVRVAVFAAADPEAGENYSGPGQRRRGAHFYGCRVSTRDFLMPWKVNPTLPAIEDEELPEADEEEPE